MLKQPERESRNVNDFFYEMEGRQMCIRDRIYDAERRKIRIIKEAGFNSIRSSHHPISKAMLDIRCV